MPNSRARQMADLLSGSAGTGTIAPSLVSDQSNTSTGYFDLPSGNTGQRPASPATGMIRHNTTIELAEYYDGTNWKAIDAPPVVSSVDVTEVDSQAGGDQTIVITGSGFSSGATTTFTGKAGTNFNASTTTVNSSTQITVVAPKTSFLNAQEPYGVKVTNTSGLANELVDQINVDSAPTWTTASGSLGTVYEDAAVSTINLAATDPDGDTVSYSVQTGALPTGLSLDSTNGQITGTPNVNDTYASGGVTHSFTLRATANNKTSDRAFTILRKWKDGSTSDLAVTSPDDVVSYGLPTGQYYINDGTRTRLYYVDTTGSEAGAAGFIRVDSSWVTTVSGAACVSGGGTISADGIMKANTNNGGGGSGDHGGCGISITSPFRARYLRITDKSFTGNANCGGVNFPDGRFQVFAAAGSSHNGSFTEYHYPGWEWQGSTGTQFYSQAGTSVFTGLYDIGSDQDIVTHLGVGSYGGCTYRPCSLKLWFKW